MGFWSSYTPPPPPGAVFVNTTPAPVIQNKGPFSAPSNAGLTEDQKRLFEKELALQKKRIQVQELEKSLNIPVASRVTTATLFQSDLNGLDAIISTYLKATSGEVLARSQILTMIYNWAWEYGELEDDAARKNYAQNWMNRVDAGSGNNYTGTYYRQAKAQVEADIAALRKKQEDGGGFWKTFGTVAAIAGASIAVVATGGAALGVIGPVAAGALGAAGSAAALAGNLSKGDVKGAIESGSSLAGIQPPPVAYAANNLAQTVAASIPTASGPTLPSVSLPPVSAPNQQVINQVMSQLPVQAPVSPTQATPVGTIAKAPQGGATTAMQLASMPTETKSGSPIPVGLLALLFL